MLHFCASIQAPYPLPPYFCLLVPPQSIICSMFSNSSHKDNESAYINESLKEFKELLKSTDKEDKVLTVGIYEKCLILLYSNNNNNNLFCCPALLTLCCLSILPWPLYTMTLFCPSLYAALSCLYLSIL